MSDLLLPRLAMKRRSLLRLFGGGAIAALALPAEIRSALAQPIFSDYPFQLGVASGDPMPDGFVLWTRLAPQPLEQGHGMPMQPVEVAWEVAADAGFKTRVQTGTAIAHPELGHSVHVEVAGLKPGRPYWYRFVAGRERSPSGRAMTLPAPGAPTAQVRFAVAGCQNYEQGYYTAYRHLSREEPDFIFHYGDYIYEYRGRTAGFDRHKGETIANPRLHAGDEIYSLTDYRRRYAQYKLDLDLQAAHAAAPWFATWDDHEVENNWAAEQDENGTAPELFRLRRIAAAQAYFEHMPLRAASFPRAEAIQIYRRAQVGDLLSLNLLDTRQYRSDQVCNGWGGPSCEGLNDSRRTLLGADQNRWLLEGLTRSEARWNALGQQVMFMDLNWDGGDPASLNLDSWTGYRAARRQILETVHEHRIQNLVVLTGDVHQNYAGNVHLNDMDGSRPGDGPVVATEFIATSISSGGDGGDIRPETDKVLAANPHCKFMNDQRGYLLCTVSPDAWQTAYRVVDRVTTPGGTISTRTTLAVEPGRPGIQAA